MKKLKLYTLVCIISTTYAADNGNIFKEERRINSAICGMNNAISCLDRVSAWFTRPHQCLKKDTSSATQDSVVAFHTLPLVSDKYYLQFLFDYRAERSSRGALDKVKGTPALIQYYNNYTSRVEQVSAMYEIGRNSGTVIHRTATLYPEYEPAQRALKQLEKEQAAIAHLMAQEIAAQKPTKNSLYCDADQSELIVKKGGFAIATSPYATVLLKLKQ